MEEKSTFHAGREFTPLGNGTTRVRTFADGGKLISDEIMPSEEAMKLIGKPVTNEFSELYGAAAHHAEHKIGETISYHDASRPSGRNTGTILHIVEASSTQGVVYVVSPDVSGFPVEIAASDVIE